MRDFYEFLTMLPENCRSELAMSMNTLWYEVEIWINDSSCQINPFSANPTKWSNALKQFVGKLPTNCLSVFDQFVGLALKGLS